MELGNNQRNDGNTPADLSIITSILAKNIRNKAPLSIVRNAAINEHEDGANSN